MNRPTYPAPDCYASVPARSLAYFVGRRILTCPADAPDTTQMQWVVLTDTNMIGKRRQAWEKHVTAWFRFLLDDPLELSDGAASHDYMAFAQYSDTNWLTAELTADEYTQTRVIDLDNGYRITEWGPPTPTPALAPEPPIVESEVGPQFALF